MDLDHFGDHKSRLLKARFDSVGTKKGSTQLTNPDLKRLESLSTNPASFQKIQRILTKCTIDERILGSVTNPHKSRFTSLILKDSDL